MSIKEWLLRTFRFWKSTWNDTYDAFDHNDPTYSPRRASERREEARKALTGREEKK